MSVRKVVVIGPECTGKSDLSQFLAHAFNTVWVPEYARQYLDQLSRPYEKQDLTEIARGQIALEDEKIQQANEILVCDTNLYVIKVWSEFKYGHCDPEILRIIETRKYDLYLLTYVDLPWVYDPLREHPDERELLFSIYQRELKSQSVPFRVIRGLRAERENSGVEAVASLLREKSKGS